MYSRLLPFASAVVTVVDTGCEVSAGASARCFRLYRLPTTAEYHASLHHAALEVSMWHSIGSQAFSHFVVHSLMPWAVVL